MCVSHWLDVSLDALTVFIELKHLFFITIWLETGLDEVIASHLDTSFTTAGLRLSEGHHDVWVNNAADKRSNGGERVGEEVCGSLEGEVASFARGSVSSIDALSINVVVFTWLFTWASLSTKLITANFVADEFSSDLFWLTKHNGDDTRNQTWSIIVGDLVGDFRTLLSWRRFWIILELFEFLYVFLASIDVLGEISRRKAASQWSGGGVNDVIGKRDERTNSIDNFLSLTSNSLACIGRGLINFLNADSFFNQIEIWNGKASFKKASVVLWSSSTATVFHSGSIIG